MNDIPEFNKIECNDKILSSWEDSYRYYYPRFTPQDILFEEEAYNNQRHFSDSSIYTWNTNGMNEYQILRLMNQMIMFSTICKTNGNDEKIIAIIIIIGKIGTLKGWWKNFLTSVAFLSANTNW